MAINPHMHGRDNADLDLCDVCYWRKRANGAKPTLSEVLEAWRKDNGIYEHGPAYKDLCKRLGEYFA